MIGAIVVTHADFSEGLVHAAEMIAGKQECLKALSLMEGDGLMDLYERIQKAKEEMDCETVFIFTDLFGATPNNAASLLCANEDTPIAAGVNLPLLLDFLTKRQSMGKEELLQSLTETSQYDFKIVRQKDLQV